MKPSFSIVAGKPFFITAFLGFFNLVGAQTSSLWGANGEAWTPQGRIPDFSFAGYHMGNDSLPRPPVKASVKDYGAKGDGTTDDTQAFLNAIATVANGALYIPAGRYKITKVLKITKGNFVLRGAGRDSTVLYFPLPLKTILGNAPAAAGPYGYWSWLGGLIWVEGAETGTKLADVAAPALRGDKTLTVASAAGITAGTMVRLVQHESDGSLGRHLHAGYASAGSNLLPWSSGKLVDWAVKVTRVAANTLSLERPLRQDVRIDWTPAVYAFHPTVTEMGLEDFTIEFPNSPTPNHFEELGYNGIYFNVVSHSWVRNVTILDADDGFTALDSNDSPDAISRFCTLTGLRLANQWRSNTAVSGHHGISLETPQDFLVTDFRLEKLFEHDLTVDALGCGNVFSKGTSPHLCFDFHGLAPFENLFTEINAGNGDRLWHHGGSPDAAPWTAAREVFWNVTASETVDNSTYTDFPQLTMVGINGFSASRTDKTWIEPFANPSTLQPPNLYVAQLARRLADHSTGTSAFPARGKSFSMKVYPNPFRSTVSFKLSQPLVGSDPGALDKGILPNLSIYNAGGKCIAELKAHYSPHTVFYSWNAAIVPGGIYQARLTVKGTTSTMRLILLK